MRTAKAANRLRVALSLAWLALAVACGSQETTEPGPSNANGATDDTGAVIGEDADANVAVEDVPAPVDLGVTDSGSPGEDVDTSVTPVCPGGPGCDCAKNEQCNSSVCLQTPDGQKCAAPCTNSCPGGFSCKQFGSTDGTFVCVPNFLSLCAPCKTNAECATQGIDALCLDYGPAGHFCGSPCENDQGCPDGYQCADAAGKKQCKLKATIGGSGTVCSDGPTPCNNGEVCVNGKCQLVTQGSCTCSKWAIQNAMKTECSVGNDKGTCKAERACTDAGLQPCNAKTPKAEVCNAQDDDCDGQNDNLPADFTCFKTAFLASGSGTACKTDAECTTPGEACNEGQCATLLGKCPGKPSCAGNGSLICNDAKTPKAELCNGEDDDCDGNIDEDFGWSLPSDPTNLIGIGKACGLGPCGGGKVQCKGLNEAGCSTDVKIQKELCDAIDNDCNGQTDDLACDDANKCTTDLCDAVSGKCSHGAAVDCDDGNQCTADGCTPLTGACTHENQTGGCDDGDKCTTGDACKLGITGVPQCVTGTSALDCDDKNVCTDDSCDSASGCVHLANAATVACYTGEAKTKGTGTCLGGTFYCADSKLGTTCVGEVTPNKTEACDGLDDDCDGQIDEGCSAVGVQITFSAAALQGNPVGGTKVTAFLGGSTPMGQLDGEPKSMIVGFFAWLLTFIK